MNSVKRNCLNCKHLEFFDNASYEILDGGYGCSKREYAKEGDERAHERKLQSPVYLARSKVCFEARNPILPPRPALIAPLPNTR